MNVTARELNRSTLARQLLLRREWLSIAGAMQRVVALQAQYPPSPYVALWNRLLDFDPHDLDAAFASHQVVKATLMRITLHAVLADDYRVFREAMESTLRAARLYDSRFTVAGLTVDDVHALIPDLLAYACRPRTTADGEAWLEQRFGEPKPGCWWALRQYAPLFHAPTGATWTFGARPSFIAAMHRPALADPEVSAAALQRLVVRYLEGFGPASIADMTRFTLLARSSVKQAFAALAPDLDCLEGPNGVQLYDIPGAPRPPEDTPAPPRLMAMWDSVLLAYADRGRVIPEEYRKLVTRSNGDVLPTVLVDGYVAGVWRATDGGIEATAFRPLSDEVWEALAGEARMLSAFLANREPRVYSRYEYWWKQLPAGETRVLPSAV